MRLYYKQGLAVTIRNGNGVQNYLRPTAKTKANLKSGIKMKAV